MSGETKLTEIGGKNMNRKEYLEKRNALLAEASVLLDAGNVDEYNAKETEIMTLDEQFEAVAKAQANMNALKDMVAPAVKVDGNINNVVAEDVDPTSTKSYRKAFMNFCKTGIIGKELMNVDASSTTSDTAAMIPTTILDEAIKEMKTYGQIFNRIRKLSIKGGLTVPISTIKPTATWTAEGTVTDRQKLSVSGSVSFTYFNLECRIATSLLAEVVTLTSFETLITQLMAEAFAKALDSAVISGTGSGEPLGITADTRVLAGQKITLSAADFNTWTGWKKKVFAKIPLSYRAGGSFIMAAGTFDGYIDGMVDANGQPIARVTYGITGGTEQRFGGKEVILVEDDIITSYDDASTADVVAIYCKLGDYAVNSNMQIMMFRWMDHDTNQWVDKAILIADGKLLDAKGVLIIKKGA